VLCQGFLTLPTSPACPILHLIGIPCFALDQEKLDQAITWLGRQFGF